MKLGYDIDTLKGLIGSNCSRSPSEASHKCHRDPSGLDLPLAYRERFAGSSPGKCCVSHGILSCRDRWQASSTISRTVNYTKTALQTCC